MNIYLQLNKALTKLYFKYLGIIYQMRLGVLITIFPKIHHKISFEINEFEHFYQR